MLTIQLNGGLGNQLFQYALGRSLGDHFSIRYDTSHLAHSSTARSCELKLFQTQGDFGLYPRIKKQKLLSERKRYHAISDKLHFLTKRYNHHILNVQDDMYIRGFWQSYKYFDHLKDKLIQELQPTNPLDANNLNSIKQMNNCNSVAIHIRRGDFQQKTLSTLHLKGFHRHTIVPLSYYHQAIEYIQSTLNNPIFYIFSNDIPWCKEHFDGDNYIFVQHNGGDASYKDMILMSHCKHNIIANSTFSRRGAYLNKNPNAIVIAPKKRYDVDLDTKDLLLPGWIQL